MNIRKLFRLKRKIRRPEYWNNLNRKDSKPSQITLQKGMDVTRLLEADKLKKFKQILRNEITKSETIIADLIKPRKQLKCY